MGMSRGPGALLIIASKTSALEMPLSTVAADIVETSLEPAAFAVTSSEAIVECAEESGFSKFESTGH